MRILLIVMLGLMPLWAQKPPKKAKALFNGKDLSGWHISEVNHHGNTKAWRVQDGVIVVSQDRPGNGGILLTDKVYKNFEFYAEVRPEWGCDGGIFLRSNEKGEAYQVMVDYLQGGVVGGDLRRKDSRDTVQGRGAKQGERADDGPRVDAILEARGMEPNQDSH